jgi:putative membrane protein
VLIFRGLGGGRRRPDRADPEQTLAERFAAGEIDEEEYHRRLETLRSAHSRPGGPRR